MAGFDRRWPERGEIWRRRRGGGGVKWVAGNQSIKTWLFKRRRNWGKDLEERELKCEWRNGDWWANLSAVFQWLFCESAGTPVREETVRPFTYAKFSLHFKSHLFLFLFLFPKRFIIYLFLVFKVGVLYLFLFVIIVVGIPDGVFSSKHFYLAPQFQIPILNFEFLKTIYKLQIFLGLEQERKEKKKNTDVLVLVFAFLARKTCLFSF